MKKWMLVFSIFVMLKSGQEVVFKGDYQAEVMENGIRVTYGPDEVFFEMDTVKWMTNDERAHKMLKQNAN